MKDKKMKDDFIKICIILSLVFLVYNTLEMLNPEVTQPICNCNCASEKSINSWWYCAEGCMNMLYISNNLKPYSVDRLNDSYKNQYLNCSELCWKIVDEQK